MSAADVVHWMLTALFAAGAVHALRDGVLARSSGWRSRVDHVLDIAMALAMAMMPWTSGYMLPRLPQTVFFAAAALWFPLTAVRRAQKSGLVDIARRLPHAAGMAAMAWMTYLTAGSSHETLAEGISSAHHTAHVGHSTGVKGGDLVTGVLALYLLVCALRSLTRDMPPLCGASGTVDVATSMCGPYNHFWHGSMALGTAIMLLMHC
ncbi:DUF5134 domain-containing protein [Streptomyces gibsoniae]|uniref:DUF5134 domain-containing protein n=1 Tax=Streptomyces gibsoniae TaxID=3075529 RepID=A0ABU2U820_9ACTN|nr:DUF5134 domain-containing protein [Streptomyces sp. DSM 41699]MDT0469137.1 DUF5134 domain-containing protein [Streptomyces sp. DSM 41699]